MPFEELLLLGAKSLLEVHVWAPRAPRCDQMNDTIADGNKHPKEDPNLRLKK
ncbi:hypothetical protein GH733_000660 [Mirounga leonina]|nr:hypothetical protein GH733_000660 [Mirounga leonina]